MDKKTGCRMDRKPTSKQENLIFPALLFFGVFAVMLVAFAPRSTRIEPRLTQVAIIPITEEIMAQPTPRDHLELMASGLETVLASDVRAGSRLYGNACTACHGINLQGISGLGKSLVNRAFVNGLNDDELVAFIIVGRTTQDPLNTTGVAMPARGGNTALSDDSIHQIVDYIRSLNGATVFNDLAEETPVVYEQREFVPINVNAIALPTTEAEATETVEIIETETPIATPEATMIAESTQSVEPTPDLPVGTVAQNYAWYCSQCHGIDGTGNPMMENSALVGMPIDKNSLFEMFIQPTTFDGLFTHAYRGGYVELTDDQLWELLDYVGVLAGTSDDTSSSVPTAPIEATPEMQADIAPIDVAQGQQDYAWYCSQCHGINGEGSPTVMNSVLVGMPIDQDALFTLFITPPAFGTVSVHAYRGGYPELSDEHLRNLLGYVSQLAGQ